MRGLGLIAYGVEGIGKTSFAVQFPKPLCFISVRESGYLDLDDIGDIPEGCEYIEIDTWQEYMAALEDTSFASYVTDSLTGVSQILRANIIDRVYLKQAKNDQAYAAQLFDSFMSGWRNTSSEWMEEWENKLEFLRMKEKHVILIGHTRIGKSKNIVSNDYQSAKLQFPDVPSEILSKWAQAILFMSMDFTVRTTKQFRGVATEAKLDGNLEDDATRLIYTTKHPAHSAKNRLKLPNFILMGENAHETYLNFVKALPPKHQQALNESNS